MIESEINQIIVLIFILLLIYFYNSSENFENAKCPDALNNAIYNYNTNIINRQNIK